MSQSTISPTSRPLTAIIVGAGHRALLYASYAQRHTDELRIVGVADLNPLRRAMVAELYGLSPAQCFESAEEVAARPQFADVIINGTMDHQHVPTSLPLLRAGYDMLLEKPFATFEAGDVGPVRAARQYQRKVIICHVLRYTPFYAAIRQQVADGVIGDVYSVQTIEHVSYHHMAVAYIRGKWSKPSVSHTSMLMAKCCHDLDLIAWMKSGVRPRSVASFGSNFQFRPENAPANAGTRCLVDCPIETGLSVLARKPSIDHPDRWVSTYGTAWNIFSYPRAENPLAEDGQSLRTLRVEVRHQVVIAIPRHWFADGTTATPLDRWNVQAVAGDAPHRHARRNQERLRGRALRHPPHRPATGPRNIAKTLSIYVGGDMHGAFGGHGGEDMRLVADFLRAIRARAAISTAPLEDSVAGHLISFSAGGRWPGARWLTWHS